MRRKVTTCDICGKEIDKYSKVYPIKVRNGAGARQKTYDMDICVHCLCKFRAFVEEAIDVSAREE